MANRDSFITKTEMESWSDCSRLSRSTEASHSICPPIANVLRLASRNCWLCSLEKTARHALAQVVLAPYGQWRLHGGSRMLGMCNARHKSTSSEKCVCFQLMAHWNVLLWNSRVHCWKGSMVPSTYWYLSMYIWNSEGSNKSLILLRPALR